METADGSFSVQQPCPPDVAYCLKVSSRSPDTEAPTTMETLSAVGRALVGAKPGAAKLKKPKLPDHPPKASFKRLRKLWDKGVDIAPGLSVPSTFDANTWTEVRSGSHYKDQRLLKATLRITHYSLQVLTHATTQTTIDSYSWG